LKSFLGYGLTDTPPDHSTVSRTRRLIDVETHGRVFTWMLEVLAKHGLIHGKTVGIDGTTLEANAAMRSIVRRDTGESLIAVAEQMETLTDNPETADFCHGLLVIAKNVPTMKCCVPHRSFHWDVLVVRSALRV
jgi:hypothetical protein